MSILESTWNVLNLGAGVQSTTLYLLAADPDYPQIAFDAAVWADTQAEPKAVYRHLEWLRKQPGPPILEGTAGSLRENLVAGRNTTGQRFVSIPAFAAPHHATRPPGRVSEGRFKRQCTKEYKVEVVAKVIRRKLMGLRPRQPVPKGIAVRQAFGFSTDEQGRALRTILRFRKDVKWSTPVFPLIELGWSRKDCRDFLSARVPHRVPRSACTFCPYRRDDEWLYMKENDPESFEDACEVDEAMRDSGVAQARGWDNEAYIHRSCIPLRVVDFSAQPRQTLDPLSIGDCHGMCGN